MSKKLVFSLLVFLLVGYNSFIYAGELSQDSTITVEQVKENLDNKEDIILLDVRTPEEYNGEQGHLEGAILIPIKLLEQRINELEKYKDKKILVMCKGGFRSAKGTRILRKAGFNALNMLAGMDGYREMEMNSSARQDTSKKITQDTVASEEDRFMKIREQKDNKQ